jgi:kynurenine formamidase
MNRDGGDYAAGAKRPGGFQFAEDTLIIPLHSGTHMDALCHVWYDDQLYNGFPSSGIRSTTGAVRCGMHTIPPVVTRGILLDLVAQLGRPLGSGEPVTDEMLAEGIRRAGVRLRRGDAVLIRTGWLNAAEGDPVAYFASEPGLDCSAGLWLAQQDVAVVGADNFAIERIPFDGDEVFPLHQRLIRDFGIPFLEGLDLRELAASERAEFMFCVAPLPVVGATASPVNPFAVL